LLWLSHMSVPKLKLWLVNSKLEESSVLDIFVLTLAHLRKALMTQVNAMDSPHHIIIFLYFHDHAATRILRLFHLIPEL